MHAEIVTLTVMLGCLLCIIHCWLYVGKWDTAGFFVGGFVFGIVRENIVSLMPGLYTYPDHPIYIGSAPLMMGFGWSASFYASWMIGKRILEAFIPNKREDVLTQSLVTGVITAMLSIPVEVAAGATQTGWWIWPPEAIRVLWEMPAIIPFGWGGAAFLFILTFLWLKQIGDKPEKTTVYFIIMTLVIIIVHLIYILGVRTVISLILGG